MTFFQPRTAESYVFFLHYKATSFILLVWCIIVTFNFFYGSPMVCTSSAIDPALVTSYCSSHSTFVTNSSDKKTEHEIPYPGVDKRDSELINFTLYKWYYILLFIQAMLFYFPGTLWQYLENGQLHFLCKKLEQSPSVDPNPRHDKNEIELHEMKLKSQAHWLRQRLGTFNRYVYSYMFCEHLSFINAILQICFINSVFKNFAIGNGKDYVKFGDQPLFFAFPKLAKCIIYVFGRSGNIQRHEAMCTLPVHELMEHFYNFLWYWIIALLILISINFIKTYLTMMSAVIRQHLLQLTAVTSSRIEVKEITKHCSFGDWFMFCKLTQRWDVVNFSRILHYLNQEMESNIRENYEKDNAMELTVAMNEDK